MRLLTLLPIAFALATAPAFSAQLESALGRLDQCAASFKGLTAEVRKVSHTAVINEDTVDEGTLYVKRPKPNDVRMLIEFKKPDVKVVSIQGRKVEVFYPKVNTVEEYDAGENRKLLEDGLLLGFGASSKELRGAYTIGGGVSETVGGQKTTKIELIPKSKEALAHLKKAELWISDASGLTVQQKFYWPGGDYLLATYTDIKPTGNLADDSLKIKLPKGVKRVKPQK